MKSDNTSKLYFKDTIIYTELSKRNIRLLVTAILIFLVSIIFLVNIVFNRKLIFLIISCILLSISIYQYILVFRRNEDIWLYPDLNRFLTFGDNYNDLIVEMDNNLVNNDRKIFSDFFFTNSFCFYPSFYRFNWFHFSEICWVYTHVTKHYTNFINTGKSYQLHVYLKTGEVVELKSDDSDDLLFEFMNIAPYAYYGFSQELKEYWDTDPRGFIISVNKRMEMFFKNPSKFIKDNYK